MLDLVCSFPVSLVGNNQIFRNYYMDMLNANSMECCNQRWNDSVQRPKKGINLIFMGANLINTVVSPRLMFGRFKNL